MAISENEAKRLYKTKWWLGKTDLEIAKFQFEAKRLCLPFEIFHVAAEKALGRPIWTHEFAFSWDAMKQELEKAS